MQRLSFAHNRAQLGWLLIAQLVLALSACAERAHTEGSGVTANPYDAFPALLAAKNVEGMVALFAEDAVYRDRTFDVEVSGHEAIRALLASTIDGFGGPALETRRVVTNGTDIVVEWVLRGTFVAPILGVPPDSAAIELEGVSLGIVENGRIRDHTDYVDRAALAARLGLARQKPTARDARP